MGLTVLDAGVMIAGLDARDAHHSAAANALSATRARGDSITIPSSAYAEILIRPAARGSAAVARIDAALDGLAISVADANREIARAAATLRARHRSLRLPDALVIATAAELDADHLLTTDQRWRTLRGSGLRGRITFVG